MLDILLSYKWWILGVCETVAWIATYYMLHAKIVLKSNFRFRLFTVIAGITGYGPHFGLGIYDYITTKKVDLFSIVIAVLLIIGFIFWRQIETAIENLVNKLHRNKTKKVKRSSNIKIEKKNKLNKG
ncbi:hypothetical protein [Priestia aryabhattai]